MAEHYFCCALCIKLRSTPTQSFFIGFHILIPSIGQRDLSEKDIDNSLRNLQLGLLESDVAQEVIDDFSAKLKKELLGLKLEKDQNAEELIRSKFQTVITEMFAKTGKVDLINKIKVKRELNSGYLKHLCTEVQQLPKLAGLFI
ncbi:MAG: signal recognition particle receptor subunit alpha [Candidatus Nitrosopolaris sp.]